MNNLTQELGGLQHVTHGKIHEGDKVTYLDGSERRISPADNFYGFNLVGYDIDIAEGLLEVAVYRKIPVAKPGGIDHCQPETRSPGDIWICTGTQSDFTMEKQPEHTIPQDSKVRKQAPMFRGLVGYFPAALFEVAAHSMEADKEHNPGSTEGPTWARGKSPDHLDCVMRHACEVGPVGSEGRIKQLRAVAWRALAALQEECEYRGAKPGVSSRF